MSKETMQDIWDTFNGVFIGATIQKSLAQELIIKAHYAGVRAAQKREPLSDKDIWTANTEQTFEEGVRWAEQQHGIGVDDESDT